MERLKYVNCSYTKKKFNEWKIDYIQEISFQGGDGYQYFLNKDLAFAALTRVSEFCINRDTFTDLDPFYESQDFGIEFVFGTDAAPPPLTLVLALLTIFL